MKYFYIPLTNSTLQSDVSYTTYEYIDGKLITILGLFLIGFSI